MKKFIVFPLFAVVLCSCQYNPKYCVGEWANVHEHYQVMIKAVPTIEKTLNYIDKEGNPKVAEENNKVAVKIDLTLKRDKNDGEIYKLDVDDFKLSDRQLPPNGLIDPTAYEDYAWVGKEIKPGNEIPLSIAFLIYEENVEKYDHLEIDFKLSAGNSTQIYLKTRNSK